MMRGYKRELSLTGVIHLSVWIQYSFAAVVDISVLPCLPTAFGSEHTKERSR